MQGAQISKQQYGIFDILELIQYIGNILHPSDLFACVQVSRHWNNSLIPLLWETIDDSKLSWPRIVQRHDEESRNYIRDVFVKNGSHIRHLWFHWRTTLDAACIGNHCRDLRSLHVAYIRHSMIQEPEYEWMEDLDREEQDEMIALRWELAMEDLSSLYLHKSLREFMEDVPLPYLVDTLASLKYLSLLENNYVAIDLDLIFSRLLALEKYSTAFSPSGNGASIQPSLRLRDAKFLDVCTYRELLWILGYVPNLESLSFGAVSVLGAVTPSEAAVIMDSTLSRVTSLQLGVRTHMLDVALDQVFALMPNLTSFTTTQLVPSIAQALSTFCTNLETVHEPYKGSLPKRLSHAVDWLLKNCPTLTKFDGIRHVLSGSIWEEPWVCQELTFLRCQVRGVQRLSSRDQERSSAIFFCGSPSEDDIRLLQLRTTSLQQQMKIYRKLATLKQLRVLDLGVEFRRLNRGLEMSEEQYLTVNGPFPDTLELTLESGLGQLETLKAMQVFGFEGVDHRIGQAELEWMARKWTKLKEMRGLHKFPARIEYKRRKDELRKHFEGLRPDVKHQGDDYGYGNGAGWF